MDGAASDEATVRLEGRGLHAGRPVSTELRKRPGPVQFVGPRGATALSELTVARADHGVRLCCERTGVDVDSVEHLLSALGGLGIRDGVAIAVEGGELPLLDGAAATWCGALRRLRLPSARPRLLVMRDAVVMASSSTYRFEVAPRIEVAAEIVFDAAAIGTQRAAWMGDPQEFEREVAWARTFGFRKDAALLWGAGRARGVDPEAVMVLDDEGAVERPFSPARDREMARHKLLDLIGDLYLAGGPALGRLVASRPGHRATHEALRRALSEGIVAPA